MSANASPNVSANASPCANANVNLSENANATPYANLSENANATPYANLCVNANATPYATPYAYANFIILPIPFWHPFGDDLIYYQIAITPLIHFCQIILIHIHQSLTYHSKTNPFKSHQQSAQLQSFDRGYLDLCFFGGGRCWHGYFCFTII